LTIVVFFHSLKALMHNIVNLLCNIVYSLHFCCRMPLRHHCKVNLYFVIFSFYSLDVLTKLFAIILLIAETYAILISLFNCRSTCLCANGLAWDD